MNTQQVRVIQARIKETSQTLGRPVNILAASKQQSVDSIRQLSELGIRSFGENYLQEALPKISALRERCPEDIEWHYIGHIQSNKTKLIAKNFHWVQTVDNVRIAQRLNDARLEDPSGEPLNCCIQVNIDQEPQKSGIDPDHLRDLVDACSDLPGLRLRGLMALPDPKNNDLVRRRSFEKMKTLLDRFSSCQGTYWDTLSMGMSADFEQAMECGATMVRLGTVLFGKRKVKV